MMKMNKIACAVALGALGALGAQAQMFGPGLQISGAVDTGYVSTNNVLKAGTTTLSTKSGAADSILGVSNVGISGSKDMGEGIQTFYKFQMGFNPSQGTLSGGPNNIFSRNAYIGVKGNAGTVSIGKQWNLSDDWVVGSIFKGGYNGGSIFKFSEFDAVSDIYNSTIKYVSPDWGGLQVGGMYGASQTAVNVTGGTLSNFGAKYSSGNLFLAATSFTEKAGDTGGSYLAVSSKLASAGSLDPGGAVLCGDLGLAVVDHSAWHGDGAQVSRLGWPCGLGCHVDLGGGFDDQGWWIFV